MLPNLSESADAAAALRETIVRQPIAAEVFWHRELPRTSQLRAAQNLGRLLTPVFGGNRSGKTRLGAAFSVAVAMGRDDPGVRAWARSNGLDIAWMPRHGGRVWVSALSHPDSLEYVRPALDRFLPPGTKRSNWGGAGYAHCTTPTGGHITLKSQDQGRDAYQGSELDFIWMDEEHDRAIWQEARARLIDRRGRGIMTLTPLHGRTWVYDELVVEAPDWCRCHWLHTPDNPHLPADAVEQILGSYGAHERAARERGEFTVLEGRVYTDFRRDLHVVPAFRPPEEWPRYRGIDFGTRNPFVCLWGALDPADDVLHVYREHYQAGWILSQHAARIRELSLDDPEPDWTVADSADLGARLTLAREHDIITTPAQKDVRAQINAVAERLRPDAEGRPHLLIHDTCRRTLREIEEYIWKERRSQADQADVPEKRGDHCMDTLAYICRKLQRASFAIAG